MLKRKIRNPNFVRSCNLHLRIGMSLNDEGATIMPRLLAGFSVFGGLLRKRNLFNSSRFLYPFYFLND